MSQSANQPSRAGGVQVFELTMDNPEDQDELNRRLRKPGNPTRRVPGERAGRPQRTDRDGAWPNQRLKLTGTSHRPMVRVRVPARWLWIMGVGEPDRRRDRANPRGAAPPPACSLSRNPGGEGAEATVHGRREWVAVGRTVRPGQVAPGAIRRDGARNATTSSAAKAGSMTNIIDQLNAAISQFVQRPENYILLPGTGGFSTPFRGSLFGYTRAADVHRELENRRRASVLLLGSNPNCPESLQNIQSAKPGPGTWLDFGRQAASGYYGHAVARADGGITVWDPLHNPTSIGNGQDSWLFLARESRMRLVHWNTLPWPMSSHGEATTWMPCSST